MTFDRFFSPAQRSIAKGVVARGAAATMAMRLANVALGYAAVVILGRSLGADGYGLFAYGVAVAGLLALAGGLGFDHFLVAALPRIRACKDLSALSGVMRFTIAMTLSVSVVLSLAAFAGAVLTRDASSPIFTSAWVYAAAMAPLIAIATLAQGALRGFKQPARAYAPEFLIVQITLLAGVSALAVFNAATPQHALGLAVLAWGGASIAAWFWVWRALPREKTAQKPVYQRKKWTLSAFWMNAAKLSLFSFGKVELLIIAALLDPVSVGIFAIAYRLGQFTLFPAFAVSAGLAPTIAELSETGRRGAMSARLAHSAMTSFLGAVAFLPVTAFAAFIAFRLAGGEFAAAWPLVAILAGGFALSTAAGHAYDVLAMTGKERSLAAVSIACLILNIAICTLLTARFGVVGAAFSTALVFIVQHAALSLIVWRKHRLRCDVIAGYASAIMRRARPPSAKPSA